MTTSPQSPSLKKVRVKPDSAELEVNLSDTVDGEQERTLVSQGTLSVQDSTVIPNIESLLQGRCKSAQRELLQNPFDSSVANA